MSAPTLLPRVAVDHLFGLSPAGVPQPMLAKGVRRPRARHHAPTRAGEAKPAAPSGVGGAPCQASWRLRLHAWAYRVSLRFGSLALARLPGLLQPSPYVGALREVPTHVGAPASGRFALGEKRKFVLNNGERMSVLTDPHGKRYVVSQSQGRGGYGKLRVAMGFDGALFAVKEMRLQSRAKASRAPVRTCTKVSSPALILEEMSVMAAASRSLVVHTCFEVEGKVYLFVPLMADDATTLATGSPGFAKVMVGRQLLLRTCEDLAAIHRRGYIHHDVKLHNILWNAAGEVSLADFGLSCTVDEKTGTARALGRTAGNMPLEYELGTAFSWSLDTFMLGLAMADFHAPQLRTHPSTGRRSVGHLLALETWRSQVLDAKGQVDVRLVGALQNLTPSEQLWDTYFAHVCAADPELGAFIIARMLNRHAAARASLAEVHAFVQGLQPPEGPQGRMAVQVMRTIACNDWERHRLLRHMRHFKKKAACGASPATQPTRWARLMRRLGRSTPRLGVGHEHAR